VPFPSPPWQLTARAWVSVFLVRDTGRVDRPGGVYGAALVDYGTGGVLAYHELVVGRLLREGRSPRIRVTDIWVDSPASRDGGRALWALPKELAELPLQDSSLALGARTTFSAVAEGRHLASGTFGSGPAAPVRAPCSVRLSQLRADGTRVVTAATGSARVVPCRASWRFAVDGPLGFLHGRRPVLSVGLRDARLRFG
jgi:Acetoacetate decarboxylase (ADC)